ncbi:hypothetical protein [Paenibacillus lignilyticus]|uniref:DUF4367 domain-containing protein n=1 Tax=Paenibacillus lignilyticus TaxID=1172615 RepID=A0ABS5CL81_9BACL|nr:hypothetical protein [Paenibacillus lignilyticus]MBP3966612.1 hypothetical protein [Paenibacillus lignilyticus]
MKHKPLNHADAQEHSISDADIENALDRLFDAVKEEEVPAVWMQDAKPRQSQSEQQPSGQQPDEELALSEQQQPQAPLRIAAINEGIRKKKPFWRKKRWLSGATAAVLASMLLFTSWGQGVMAAMLGTFRVQHFETIEISQSDLNAFQSALQDGTVGSRELDLNRYGDIQQQGGGQQRQVDEAEAAQLAGSHALKQLPGEGDKVMKYMPEQQVTFNLHPKEINKLLAMFGGKTKFPDSVENSPIVLKMPGTFMTKRVTQEGQTAKQLIQMPAPSLEVSDDIDVEQIRQAVLDLPVIPEDMRAKLAGIGDWRTTLPIPSTSTDNIHTTKVDGNEAIVTVSVNGRSIIWLQNDWVYQLSGSMQSYPTEEAILNEARGIMK